MITTRLDKEFIALRGGYFNSGRQGSGSIHAPSAYPDGEGGVYCIYNVTEGRQQDGWSQIMSIPRRYTLGEANRLYISPAGDIESLRKQAVELNNIELPDLPGNGFRRSARKHSGNQRYNRPWEAKYIRLKVLRSHDMSEYTSVNFHRRLEKTMVTEVGISVKV